MTYRSMIEEYNALLRSRLLALRRSLLVKPGKAVLDRLLILFLVPWCQRNDGKDDNKDVSSDFSYVTNAVPKPKKEKSRGEAAHEETKGFIPR